MPFVKWNVPYHFKGLKAKWRKKSNWNSDNEEKIVTTILSIVNILKVMYTKNISYFGVEKVQFYSIFLRDLFSNTLFLISKILIIYTDN